MTLAWWSVPLSALGHHADRCVCVYVCMLLLTLVGEPCGATQVEECMHARMYECMLLFLLVGQPEVLRW
jgi:hypothetical protein